MDIQRRSRDHRRRIFFSTPSVLVSGLSSYWNMNETSGTRFDSAGTYSLTDNNTIGSNTGKIGNAADLNGTNEYFSNTNSIFSPGDTDFSFAGWFYPTTIAVTANCILSRYSASGQLEYTVDLYSAAGQNHFRFMVSADGSTIAANTDTIETISLNAWHFFVVCHDSVNNTIWHWLDNGTKRTVSYSGTIYQGSSEFRVGLNYNLLARYFSGRIDELGYWNRTISDTDYALLWNGGTGITFPFT